MIGDTMYIVSPKPNYVYALDLTKEGVIKWEFRPTMDVALASAQTCCGAQTRGLYYAEGKIFYATLDGQVIGLDAKSGEQLWRTVGTDITRYEGMAGNGLVVHKNFLVGHEGGEGGDQQADGGGACRVHLREGRSERPHLVDRGGGQGEQADEEGKFRGGGAVQTEQQTKEDRGAGT